MQLHVFSKDAINSYLLVEGKEAIFIDPSGQGEEVIGALKGKGATLNYILLTHAHPSHSRDLASLREITGARLCLHRDDLKLLQEIQPGLEPDLWLKDGQKLTLGGISLKVIHTPGHTPGSVCFYIKDQKVLFTGDTLLKGRFGKIWGPHSMNKMLYSLKRLNNLIHPATVVYPGHGPPTTMKEEAWLWGLDQLS